MKLSDIPLIIVLMIPMIGAGLLGYTVGYREGKMVPCGDIVLEEIVALQKDQMECQANIAMLMIQYAYLEKWKNKTFNITEVDKELIRESLKQQIKGKKNGNDDKEQ